MPRPLVDIAARVRRDEAIDLERGLVRIPSYTTEEAPLARWIFNYMTAIGLKARLDPVPLGDTIQSFNVIGEIQGTHSEPSLLITGHMDHAPALGRTYDDLSGWQRPPFEGVVEGDWFYGKGSQDEKGGLCAMLLAAKALLEEGFVPKGPVYFVPVQGHKRVSSGTRHLLASGFRPTYVVNTENSGNTIIPTWVGRAEGRIHIRARAGGREIHFHFKEVDPTVRARRTVFEQASRVLAALGPEMTPSLSTAWMSFTPNARLSGYPQYRIEKIETVNQMHAIVSFQIRTVPGQTEETLRADLQKLLGTLHKEDPYFDATLDFPTAPVRPAADLPGDHLLIQGLTAAHVQATGSHPEVSSQGRLGAAADASFFAAAGIPTVLYGPGGGMTDVEHQRAVHEGAVPPDERISVQSIIDAAKAYAIAVMHLCG